MEEPKVIKFAKLVICMTDREVDTDTKVFCIRDALRNSLISEEEAIELLLRKEELDNYRYD